MHPNFLAALFITGEICKQPKCPLTDEWIKKTWCIYTMDHYSSHKKNETMLFTTTWMNLQITILSEVSQRKTNMISLICGILKNGTNKLIYKMEIVSQIFKIN